VNYRLAYADLHPAFPRFRVERGHKQFAWKSLQFL